MSLIDDLKASLEKTSIKPNEAEKVVSELSKRYGGSFPYVRKKEGKRYFLSNKKAAF